MDGEIIEAQNAIPFCQVRDLICSFNIRTYIE